MKQFIPFLFVLMTFISCDTELPQEEPAQTPPNILFIMSDDHARKAISAYDTTLIRTPAIDRIADEGILIRNGFVTNSICAPARAAILTSKYSHLNGLRDNRDRFDGDQLTFPKLLREAGYETSIIGKWHLKSVPQGFDRWEILVGQGEYYNPRIVTEGDTTRITGYTTNVITDLALKALDERDTTQPFMMMVHHKAPHRNWIPDLKYLDAFPDDLPEPDNLFDDYTGRQAAAEQDLGIDRMFMSIDMKLKQKYYGEESGSGGSPDHSVYTGSWDRSLEALTEEQRSVIEPFYDSIGEEYLALNPKGRDLVRWKYQRYIHDYLSTVISVDDGVGRLLDYLDEKGLTDNTIVVYTSDQGFYLGEHGWYDKRFMYEESFGTPMMIRFPNGFSGGTNLDELVVNIDWAPTFLDYAGVTVPEEMQGLSLRPLLEGDSVDWREEVYYHYYEYPHGWHSVKRHFGIRTDRYKLIHYYNDIDTWELYDLQNDPFEMKNLIDHPEYMDIQYDLEYRLRELRENLRDTVE